MHMPATELKTRYCFIKLCEMNLGRGVGWAIIDSSVRRALGRETLGSILTGQRNDITRSIGDEVMTRFHPWIR